jgi:hypothetical protein
MKKTYKDMPKKYKEHLNYFMWCMGRLEEVRRQGWLSLYRNGKLVGKRTCSLPKEGWKFYLRLKARGFKPEPKKVRWTLEAYEGIPQDEFSRLFFFCMIMDGRGVGMEMIGKRHVFRYLEEDEMEDD